MKNKNTLWSKDFTFITIGTIISAIAGSAIGLPLSLIVFDQTKSTLLSGLIIAIGTLPSFIIPILIAPIIDNFPKKRNIVFLDGLSIILYLLFGVYVKNNGFSYISFLIFRLIMGIINSVYELSFNAWYPDLIPQGQNQKGYAISSMIYPTTIIFMSPISVILYENLAFESLFLIVGGLLFIATILELFITSDSDKSITNKSKFSLNEYKNDFKKGFEYLKKEKGVRNIYIYMSLVNGLSMGNNLMTQVHFQTSPFLTAKKLSIIKSAETTGRLFGGIFSYSKQIPKEKRYSLTKYVYLIYGLLDGILLFLSYPMMIINRFICGGLGINSATIREASIQEYLPANMRAKINAVFQTLMAFLNSLIHILVGWLGDFINYRFISLSTGVLSLIFAYFLIIKAEAEVGKVYNG